jgi:hypothetical protein
MMNRVYDNFSTFSHAAHISLAAFSEVGIQNLKFEKIKKSIKTEVKHLQNVQPLNSFNSSKVQKL